tara:strand:+ start:87 stop:899 length:813 start_codon:yes stop_codon:yes gene_type:complete
MKKIFIFVFLGLIISFNVEATTNFVFKNNFIKDGNFITTDDPTTFKDIQFVKEKKILWWDKRKAQPNSWKKNKFKIFLFNVNFETGHKIKIRVNSEFKTKDKAKEVALKYGKIIGQLPNFSRKKLKTVTIHKGSLYPNGGNKDILIYTDFFLGDALETGFFPDGLRGIDFVEELLLHESGHVNLDWGYGGSLRASKWSTAQKKDNIFISEYAFKNPNIEDVSETIIWWVAVRCNLDIISKSNYKKIIEAIPNRLKYLDEQSFDTYPLICK